MGKSIHICPLLAAWSRFSWLEAADCKYLYVDQAVKHKEAPGAPELETDERGWLPHPVPGTSCVHLAVVNESR